MPRLRAVLWNPFGIPERPHRPRCVRPSQRAPGSLSLMVRELIVTARVSERGKRRRFRVLWGVALDVPILTIGENPRREHDPTSGVLDDWLS